MLSINISKKLDSDNNVLRANLEIKEQEFVVLMGDSGSGKTTFLRIIAGLESASGVIKFNDNIWLKDSKTLPIQKRGIGFIFQDYALFSNMSVEENLLYVKKDRKLAHYLLSITKLTSLKDRKTKLLSGGQKQRVALCRAFMNRPKLLLMDEPLSALDLEMRETLRDKIKLLHDEFKTTTIVVTHSLSEAYKLSDRIFVMDGSNVVQKDMRLDFANLDRLKGEIIKIDKSTATLLVANKLITMKLNRNDLKVGDSVDIVTSFVK